MPVFTAYRRTSNRRRPSTRQSRTIPSRIKSRSASDSNSDDDDDDDDVVGRMMMGRIGILMKGRSEKVFVGGQADAGSNFHFSIRIKLSRNNNPTIDP
jgi:hypothetical protein